MKNRDKKSNKNKHDDFLPALNKIFAKARYFGVLNKYGLNFASFFSILLFVMLLILEMCALWKLIRMLTKDGGVMVARVSGSIFYGNALLSLFLSSRFMTSWEGLSAYWLRTELASTLNIPPDLKIRQRTVFVALFVGACALVEHTLSMISATGLTIPPEQYFQSYILNSHEFVMQAQDYTLWLAIPIFILSKLATALWNFQDLIIILISMGLTSRYHRLNLYVMYLVKFEKRFKGKQKFGTELYLQIQVWRRVREAYSRQVALVRIVDRKLGALVLLSNINNLYFICLQLYLGIHREKGSPIDRAYYLLSLSWLLIRACGVVLAAADVHTHSLRVLNSLNVCPSAAYNVEVKRLKYQLSNDHVALTGMGLFSLKRQLLLEVAAAIVKYELVLVQYDQ